MTEPGMVFLPKPSWWVRKDRTGTNTGIWGWKSSSRGGSIPFGQKAGSYRWSSVAVSHPIHFESVGAGAVHAATESHTVGATAKALVIAVHWATYSGASTLTTTTDAGGGTTSIPQLAAPYQYGRAGSWYLYLTLFGLINPPTGTQTFTISIGGSGGYSAYGFNSVTYTRTARFGTVQQAAGTGKTLSHTVSSAVGQQVVQAFGNGGPDGTTLSGYSGTTRWTHAAQSGFFIELLGDAPGRPSFAFHATSNNSAAWGSVAVPLLLS